MSDFVSLCVHAMLFLAFFALLLYVVNRTHGVTPRQQLDGLVHLLRLIVIRFAVRIVPKRRYQRSLVDRHMALCASARGSGFVLQMTTRTSRVDSEVLEEAEDRHADAIMGLRDFLSGLDEHEITELAEGLNFIHYDSRLDATGLRAFVAQEQAAAGAASDSDVVAHFYRFVTFASSDLEPACQPAEKAL